MGPEFREDESGHEKFRKKNQKAEKERREDTEGDDENGPDPADQRFGAHEAILVFRLYHSEIRRSISLPPMSRQSEKFRFTAK